MSKQFKRVEKPKIEERFDYAEQVRRQIDRCLQSFSEDDGTIEKQEITKNTILALENLIPILDRDAELEKDLENAQQTIIEDLRDWWCGVKVTKNPDGTDIPLTAKNTRTFKKMNTHQYFRACFNQFVRLSVVVRRTDRS